MTLEKRLENLERLVGYLSKKVDDNKFYQDADNGSIMNIVGNVTPYTATKTAYIDDTNVIFKDVPSGNLSIYMVDSTNNSVPCSYARINGDLIVSFEKRKTLATVSLSIL